MSHKQNYILQEIEKLLSNSRISKANLEILKKYDLHGKSQQLSLYSRYGHLLTLRKLALLVPKDFKDMKKEDIENFYSSLREVKPETRATKGAYIKQFFKWLCNSNEYPSNVKWINTTQNRKPQAIAGNISHAMSREKEYLRAIEKKLADSRISKANLETLKKYDTQGLLQQVTIGTREHRLSTLWQLALFVSRDFKDMKKEDIENFFSSLRELKPKTWIIKGAFIKAFFKWLYDSDEYPANVKWIKTSLKSNNHKLPSELLTLDEIKAMVEATDNPRDRAFVSVLYDSGCRVGEILNLKIKDVIFDQYGSVIMVDGKTGMRRVRLIESSPDLVKWINNHPLKQNRESPVFISLININGIFGNGLNHGSAEHIIKKSAKIAGINKKVHPHLLRHSRLTELARDFSESELKVIAGWAGDSKMAGVYIHLSGGDIEKKMLERHGLLNKANDISTLETVKEIPDQKLTVNPDQKLTETLGKLTETPEKLTEIKRGRPKNIIQGFTLSLYEFIKEHEGISISDICNASLKKKESVKPILSRLKEYGFITNSNGYWYSTSKVTVSHPDAVTVHCEKFDPFNITHGYEKVYLSRILK